MANVLHSTLIGADVGSIVRWTVADETARLALTLTTADNGRVAHQTDDDTYWILADFSVPTWVGSTNATHTGEVTGATALTITPDAVTLAKMAPGTAGNLITYDAAGDPAAVATGTATQVLTSNGLGAAPTMQDAQAGEAQLHSTADTFGGNVLLLWQGDNGLTDDTSNHTFGSNGAPEFGIGYVPDTHAAYGTEGNGNWWSTAVAQSGGGETDHRRGTGQAVSGYCLFWFDEGLGNSTPYLFKSGVNGAGSTINYALILVGEELSYQDSGSGGLINSGIRVPRKTWVHVGFTRSAADVANVYMNGTLVATSGTLNTPTAAGDFFVMSAGVAANGYCQLCRLQSLKVVDVELSAAQMLQEARLMLGR